MSVLRQINEEIVHYYTYLLSYRAKMIVIGGYGPAIQGIDKELGRFEEQHAEVLGLNKKVVP